MGVYTDLDTVKAALGLGDEIDDDLMEAMIQTASDDIEDVCGQRFDLGEGTDETRYFASSGSTVRIGPIVSLTSLHTDTGNGAWATELDVEVDFVLEPWNAAVTGIPWQYATLIRSAGGLWPDAKPNVKVVGKFGWNDPPAKVKTAAQILATRYYKRKDSPFAIIQGETTSTRIARQDPDVYRLLLKFMRGPLQG